MIATSNKHLEEAQILQAIVDTSDLPNDQQAHLAACPVCLAEKDRLDRMLLQVGNMAKASAPAVTGRLVLPDRRPGFLQRWFFGAGPWARIAVPSLLVLVVVTAVSRVTGRFEVGKTHGANFQGSFSNTIDVP